MIHLVLTTGFVDEPCDLISLGNHLQASQQNLNPNLLHLISPKVVSIQASLLTRMSTALESIIKDTTTLYVFHTEFLAIVQQSVTI